MIPTPPTEPNPLKDLLEKFKQNWNLLSPLAGWIIAIISGFLNPPPTNANYKGLLYVIVLLWTAGMLYFLRQWNRATDAWRWVVLTSLCLVAMVVAVPGYFHLESSWTAPIDLNKRASIGNDDDLTEYAKNWKQKYPEKSAKDLIDDFGGNIELIWKPDTRTRRATWMGVAYVLCGALITTALAAGLQVLYCLGPSGRGASTRPRKRNALAHLGRSGGGGLPNDGEKKISCFF
jgi:hypothetical protein